MSYESSAEPIRIGYLSDTPFTKDTARLHPVDALDLVFRDGFERGIIDRPVEIVFREAAGLPRGTVRSVVRTFEELADEGCLAVIGPHISDNAPPVRRAIERGIQVPTISMCGIEEWMGEWTFALPVGSMTDEPRAWARLAAKRGCKAVGVVIEQSLIGETYARNFRAACRFEGLRIVGEEPIAQTARIVGDAIGRLHAAGADALVHCGFGLGVLHVNPALAALGWNPPRFTGTAWQMAFATPALWNAFVGWTGLDLYDEGNGVGQGFLDRFEQAHGHRPANFGALVSRDLATIVLHALADAQPLSPEGVRDALERVKLIPAACGAPGTHISFGKWMRRGWVGSQFLVAREVDPDGSSHHLVDRAIFH